MATSDGHFQSVIQSSTSRLQTALLFFGAGFVCLLLGLFIATANWMMTAALLGGLVLLILTIIDMRQISLIWLVGIPTVFVFANDVLKVVPVVTADRVIFGILLAKLLVTAAFNKTRDFAFTSVEKRALLFLGLMLLSLLSTFGHKPLKEFFSLDVAFYMQGYGMPIAAFFIARRIEWKQEYVERLLWWLLGAGIFLAMTAVLQRFLGIDTFVPTYMKVIHSEGRATGTFSNASEFGLVMNALLLVGMCLYFKLKDKVARTMVLVVMAAILGGVLLSETRATWVGTLISILIVYAYDRRSRPLLTFCAVLAGFAAVIAVPFILDSVSVYQRITDMSPIYNRLAAWATGINMMIHHPFLGIGFAKGVYGAAKLDYMVGFAGVSGEWARDLSVPHNEYVNMGVLTGFIGLALYLSLFKRIFVMLKDVYHQSSVHPFHRDLAVYAGAIVVSYMVNGFFVDTGNFNYIAILMYFLLGIVAAGIKPPGSASHHANRS